MNIYVDEGLILNRERDVKVILNAGNILRISPNWAIKIRISLMTLKVGKKEEGRSGGGRRKWIR